MRVQESLIKVRYGETDQGGVVHHSSYWLWFEVARTDYLRAIGHRYRDMEAQGVILPVIELQCKYIAPARYDDELRVRVWVPEYKRLKITFDYEIYNENEKLITRARTVLGCITREGKPQALPDALLSALSAE